MSDATLARTPEAAELAAMDALQLVRMLRARDSTIESLRAQIEWFRRQIFGSKSERYAPQPDGVQMHLGELLPVPEVPEVPTREVPAHRRRSARSDFTDDSASAPFFDAAKVPVVTIEVPCPEAAGLAPEQYEVIGHKESHRLAQRPGAYVVLKYRRALIKRRDIDNNDGSATLHCAAAPVSVIEGSRADVSFVAAAVLDKFQWHLPLYRQHQRLEQAGFKLSRQWLTGLVGKAIALLEPVYDAQLESIRRCRIKTADETPIKAGRAGPGKMRAGYFWPVYGELHEVCFAYFGSREHRHVFELLGLEQPAGAVLLSDGYGAYDAFAKKTGVVHAQCWTHMRRNFHDALGAAPTEADCALRLIAPIHALEGDIAKRKLQGEAKRLHRLEHTKPHVERFFAWAQQQFESQGLLPSNKLTQALAYALERKAALQVFLQDAEVSVDTNHVERAIRPIALGRRNWLFCWTEVGAKHAGIAQSLIATCRLHEVDPYTYLVDVLQRVGQHPASRVAELTPRLWKQHFAESPLRSDLHEAA